MREDGGWECRMGEDRRCAWCLDGDRMPEGGKACTVYFEDAGGQGRGGMRVFEEREQMEGVGRTEEGGERREERGGMRNDRGGGREM
jgi:hypothetical protein